MRVNENLEFEESLQPIYDDVEYYPSRNVYEIHGEGYHGEPKRSQFTEEFIQSRGLVYKDGMLYEENEQLVCSDCDGRPLFDESTETYYCPACEG